ncbi:MAG: hypothetical protein LKE85_17830 [Lachnospiraceae bacterium]|jgi:hypothetical protein|nr:hypothetical protein [Lachnospiraceae bacterium]
MNNIYANDELAKATAVAQFRFALIAPVIQGLYSDASATEYYKRITEKPLKLPDGTAVTYSYKTVEKWASMYKRGGYDALMPQARSDKALVKNRVDGFHTTTSMVNSRRDNVR